MNLEQSIAYGVAELQELEHPRLESEVLLCYVLDQDRVFLRTQNQMVLAESDFILYKKCIRKLNLD